MDSAIKPRLCHALFAQPSLLNSILQHALALVNSVWQHALAKMLLGLKPPDICGVISVLTEFMVDVAGVEAQVNV
jgi:hypothetical protein